MRTTRRGLMALGLASGLAPTFSAPARAAPRARLISAHWRSTGVEPGPSNARWTSWLRRYRRMGEDGIARVAYHEVERAGREGLATYLGQLQKAWPTRMTRDAAFAYWVNLYNAQTVALVLEAWPVDSIREVRGGLFNLGPWDEKIVTVEGEPLSLDDIEHGVLRPVWQDPRVHYALNCAALGCPNLRAEAWEADGLDAALDAAARAYVNHPRGARLADDELVVSSIYDWFRDDFGGREAGVLEHLRAHADPGLAAQLAGRTSYDDHDYDWGINAVA